MTKVDLSPLRELEEVTFNCHTLDLPCRNFKPILDTVTSSSVRKITFEIHDTIRVKDIDYSYWSDLDAVLLTMAGKLDGTGKKLEIVFEVVRSNFKLVDPGEFLPKCRTKATVKFCCNSDIVGC